MASTTANYGFTKPDKGATGWDVDLNKNFDDIDAQIKARADESASRYTKTEADNTFAAKTQIGDLAVLSTTAKDSIVNALNEVFNEVNSGKTSIYGAIVDKGVTPSSQAFADLVTAIGAITTGGDVTIEGTATAPDILEGKTATVPSGVITGTMPNNGSVTITPGTTDQAIEAGYHDGTGKVVGDSALITDNIKSGSSIFGVTGKTSVVDTADATATTTDIAAGKTAYVNGAKVTGTLAVQATAAQTITPGTTDVVKPAGIYDGAITIKGDANLIAANIKSGVSIFGVLGTFVGNGNSIILHQNSSSDYITVYYTEHDMGNTSYHYLQLNNIGFVPKIIIAIADTSGYCDFSVYCELGNVYNNSGPTVITADYSASRVSTNVYTLDGAGVVNGQSATLPIIGYPNKPYTILIA